MSKYYLKQIHCLNSVLALTTHSDPDVYESLKRALKFTALMSNSNRITAQTLDITVKTLLSIYFKDQTAFHYYHCSLQLPDLGPLWIQSQILFALQELRAYDSAFLLVTGLRSLISANPEGQFHSRSKVYREYVTLIEANCNHYAKHKSTFRLLIL
jgi:hypothetical protein